MNAIVSPIIKYGFNCGLFELASKNLVIPIAELGPLPASLGFDLKNFTIQTTIFIYSKLLIVIN
jgi:hypothetical protein